MKPWGLFLVSQGSEKPSQIPRLLSGKFQAETHLLVLLIRGRECGGTGGLLCAGHSAGGSTLTRSSFQPLGRWCGARV